jgi:hypothetical protein
MVDKYGLFQGFLSLSPGLTSPGEEKKVRYLSKHS